MVEHKVRNPTSNIIMVKRYTDNFVKLIRRFGFGPIYTNMIVTIMVA